MTKNSAGSAGRKLDRFLSDLSSLIDTFPSQETKSRLDHELGVLIGFLKEFRERLQTLPTTEDMDGVESAIEMVKDQLRIAESDPVLSRVMGLLPDNGASRRAQQKPLTKEEREEARAAAATIKEMGSEGIRLKLADRRKYKNAMLRQIGNELGLHFSSKSTRSSMIDQIVKKMANLRGYRSLRYGDHRKTT